MTRASFLVFTDLDGSLLDHHDYSYRAAVPALAQLNDLKIPVILASSKTRAEIEHLRQQLGNAHPFIAENGAAAFIPVGYFSQQPEQTVRQGAYWVKEMSAPRSAWLAVLHTLSQQFPGDFEHFEQLGPVGIARLTGLTTQEAALANQREYSEPVSWQGNEGRKEIFLKQLQAAGAQALSGGRFLCVSGDCDKGRALAWVRSQYALLDGAQTVNDLAIGDSGNDIAMLECAQTALVIRSPVHGFPQLSRHQGVIHSDAFGPAGWTQGVTRWLQDQGLQ